MKAGKGKRMIVDGMTYAEIIEVAKTDETAVLAELVRRAPVYERNIKTRRGRGPVYFKPFEIERPTGITWYARFFTNGYADYKRGGLSFLLYGRFYFNGYLWVIWTYGRPFDYALFTYHFFDRYRQRYLSENDRDTVEVIHEYFRYNSLGANKTPRDGGIYCTTAQGAALGIVENGTQVYKTFITPELMREEQQRAREQGLTIINEYNTTSK